MGHTPVNSHACRDALGDIQDFPYPPSYQAAFRLRRLHTLSLAEAQDDMACAAPRGMPGAPRTAYTAPPTIFSAAWRAQVCLLQGCIVEC